MSYGLLIVNNTKLETYFFFQMLLSNKLDTFVSLCFLQNKLDKELVEKLNNFIFKNILETFDCTFKYCWRTIYLPSDIKPAKLKLC